MPPQEPSNHLSFQYTSANFNTLQSKPMVLCLQMFLKFILVCEATITGRTVLWFLAVQHIDLAFLLSLISSCTLLASSIVPVIRDSVLILCYKPTQVTRIFKVVRDDFITVFPEVV